MITILLPFYNSKLTIRNCILSILNQSYSDYKVYLLDDGSDDEYFAEISDLLDDRFTLFKNAINMGLIKSLNFLVSKVETEFVARMDSDDIMHPNRLEKQFKFMSSNNSIDVLDTLMVSFDERYNLHGIVRYSDLSSIDFKSTIFSTPLSHATIMARSKWMKKNLYNNDFYRAEDHELFSRTFRISNFARLYEPLYFVRSHSINIVNYIAALKTQRKIIRINRENLATTEYFKFISRNYFKVILYKIFGFFEKQHILVKTRNLDLNKLQYDELNSQLAIAITYKI
jgi:glycosyltransferase involved in cell wall biosynthesis